MTHKTKRDESTKIAMPEEGSPTLHLYSVISDHTIISKVPKAQKKNYQSEKYTTKTNFWSTRIVWRYQRCNQKT